MEIFLNNKSLQIASPCSVESLLELYNYHQTKGMAVAVNDVVIARQNWKDHLLQEQDHILVISAVQGG